MRWTILSLLQQDKQEAPKRKKCEEKQSKVKTMIECTRLAAGNELDRSLRILKVKSASWDSVL